MFNFIQKSILVENISQQSVATAVCSAPFFTQYGISPDMISLEAIGGGQVYKIFIDVPNRHVDSDMAGNVTTILALEQALAGVNFGRAEFMGLQFPYKPAKFVTLSVNAINIRFTYSVNIKIPPEMETQLATMMAQRMPDTDTLGRMYEGELTPPLAKRKLMENKGVDPMLSAELKLNLGSKAMLKKTLGYTGDNHLGAAIASMKGRNVGEEMIVEMGLPVFYGSTGSVGSGDYINMKTLLEREISGILSEQEQDLLKFSDHGIRFLPASSDRAFELIYSFRYKRA